MLTWTRGSPSTVTSGGNRSPASVSRGPSIPATSIGSVWSIDSVRRAASSPPTVTVEGVTWTDEMRRPGRGSPTSSGPTGSVT